MFSKYCLHFFGRCKETGISLRDCLLQVIKLGDKIFNGSFISDSDGEIIWDTKGVAPGAYAAAILIDNKYLVAKKLVIH